MMADDQSYFDVNIPKLNHFRFYISKITDLKNEAENRLKVAWQNYCESGDDLDANSPMNKRTARLPSVDDEMLPLSDEVLIRNLGLDIVVVVTKVRFCGFIQMRIDMEIMAHRLNCFICFRLTT